MTNRRRVAAIILGTALAAAVAAACGALDPVPPDPHNNPSDPEALSKPDASDAEAAP